ncbi:MAG: transporter substrate-binding domain-containing protein [Deltaproteobacteria bacterium]|nr:transporter substrate-binding domain-containing protein [Deltaproteobacteria bacterium]
MRRKLCRSFLLGASLLCASGQLAPALLSAEVSASEPNALRVCLLENNLPYSSRQENSGFDFDVAKAVADGMGKSFLPVWTSNSTRIDEIEESDFPTRKLARNVCDAIFSLPGQDAIKDAPKLALGAPYYGAAFQLIAKEQNALNNLMSLGTTPVAIQSQTIANFVLNARKARMQTFFSTEEALNSLVKGETALALLWGPVAGWHLRNHPDLKLFFVSGYEPPTVVRWNEHVATRASDTDLRNAIDVALKNLDEKGTLQALAQHYGIPLHKPFASTYSFAEMQKLN